MSERFVVIMAGGSGTRFWPASRKAHPKQFLALGAAQSLLRQTAERVVGAVVDWDHLVVVTGAGHAEHARAELPELPPENLLVEPVGRNTAPCIGYATWRLRQRDPSARLAVLPADHFISDPGSFREHLEAALEAATSRLVLLGLVPTRPETGYGYIQTGDPVTEARGMTVRGVRRFVEKPSRDTAEAYLREGDYLWNGGMFVFPIEVMEREIRTHLPELARGLDALAAEPEALDRLYPGLPSVSIDYGVMEKASGVTVLPASFPWSDVGSWDAARALEAPTPEAVVAKGDALLVDSAGVFVDARAGRFVALVGVRDLIVVDTKDALLVVERGRSQDVKKVVEALEKARREELL